MKGPAVDSAMGEPRYIDVNGVSTRYFVAGAGEPLLLIHGWQFGMDQAAEQFAPVFELLARQFRVIAVDKLGQGGTGDPLADADWSMRGVIDHLLGFIAAVGLDRFYLLGHSRGALPAARIALERADQVSKLVIVNTNTLAPDDPSTPVDYYVKLVERKPPRSPRWATAIGKLEALTAAWVADNPDRVAAEPSLGIALAPTPWWVEPVKRDTLERLGRGELKPPVLVFWGLNDESAPPALGMKLMQVLSASDSPARLVLFARCGHSPHQEYPREFARLTADFLRNEAGC